MTIPARALRTAVATIALAATALFGPHVSSAATGDITGSLPPNGGFGLIVWGGGSLDQLVTAAGAAGCRVASIWSASNAGFVGDVLGAPAIVNRDFQARYPASVPPATPLIIVCYGPSEVFLSLSSVYQAGAVEVRITRAKTGSAVLFGREFPLTSDGSDLVGYVGVGIDDPPGGATLTLSFTDANGVEMETARALTILKTQWTVDYITLPPPPPPDPNAPPPPPEEQPRLDAIYAGVSPRRWQSGWAPPLAGPLDVTSYFGEERSYNGGPVGGHHTGTDLAANEGTEIYASNDGIVVLAELTLERGNLVVLDHGGGVFSAYGHMSRIVAKVGDAVTRGQLIGYVGSTGLATGPHLHWEIAVGGFVVDGLRWLDHSQGF